MIEYLIIFTIIYIIFIELYIGSILFRYDSKNHYRINIPSLISYMCHPFHNRFLWNKELLITNYPFLLCIMISIYYIYK